MAFIKCQYTNDYLLTNDLNTYKYLTYLLSQRPDAKMSDEQLEQLAPWSETAKANCQN